MEDIKKQEIQSEPGGRRDSERDLCGCLVVDDCGCIEDACQSEPSGCDCFLDPCACQLR
jgi:hypothetical protein